MNSLLEEILERTDILDVVSQHVTLRKTGRNYTGLCPFHKEKTPSFTVSTEKQIYYCFGCHEGGNAVHFLSKIEHTSFHETIEALADHYGIQSHRRTGTSRTPIFDALSKLAEMYHGNLKRSKFGMSYLASRGITAATADEFKMGYSEPAAFKAKDFTKQFGIPLDVLINLGMAKGNDTDVHDIFRGRLVLPILDVNGKVIGFGGRATRKEAMPKYLNSPESPVFSKRSVLFGIDKSKRYITEADEVIVVEGYFDLISLYEAGIRNGVATLGTSITEEQLSRLRNYTENVTLMLDGDEAGVKSTMRLVGIFGGMGLNGSMVILPDGYDPDSFVREKGVEALQTTMTAKRPLMDCFFEYYVARGGVSSLESKLRFIRAVMPSLREIRDGVRKRLYVQRLAELTGVEEYRFWDDMKETGDVPADSGRETKSAIERKVVGILVNRPELTELFKGKEVKTYIRDTDLAELAEKAVAVYMQSGRIDLNQFVGILEKPGLREIVTGAVLEVADYSSEDMERMVRDFFLYMEQKQVREEARKITAQLTQAEKNGDDAAIRELMERKREVLMFLKSKSAK